MLPEQDRLPVVPSRVQPVSDAPPDIATVPLAPLGPTLMLVVAPPPKLMVVAVVLSRSKDELPVVKDVATLGDVMLGAFENTTTPPALPVSSVRDDARTEDAADVTTLLDASRNKARLAVNAERLIVLSASTVPPVPLASSVRLPFAPVAMVRAPESAMLLVVNVWEPMVVPVMNEPTPALLILVVPLRSSATSVRSRLNVPAPALLTVNVSAPAVLVRRVEEPPLKLTVVSAIFNMPVPPASRVRSVLVPEESVTAPEPVYELPAAIDTPASDVIESAFNASCTSTLPPALMVRVDCVDVMPPAPLTAKVPAVVTLPVAWATVKFVLPTVRSEPVTSSPA